MRWLPATQKLLGGVIGRVMECGETLGDEGRCQGGAVDLDAVMPGGIALREMLGHGRLWDEEMNAAAQGEK
ncbi:hypothetical protein Xmlh_21530 [Xanthomonas axonopodis pv. melhusii]|uniref:Uncharacterized protein n=1 Tax=Xanthomonas axonopodis pv. melhusii TaxID=487834 RepID=A0A1T1NLB5_9XANT|nr:hypothetical protein Xmlh_21530 [Xanthomonas axonopodis pv. melhusii]